MFKVPTCLFSFVLHIFFSFSNPSLPINLAATAVLLTLICCQSVSHMEPLDQYALLFLLLQTPTKTCNTASSFRSKLWNRFPAGVETAHQMRCLTPAEKSLFREKQYLFIHHLEIIYFLLNRLVDRNRKSHEEMFKNTKCFCNYFINN